MTTRRSLTGPVLILALVLAIGLPLAGLVLQKGWLPAAGVLLAAFLWVLGLRYQNHPLINLAFAGLLSLDVMVMLIPQTALFGQAGGLLALAAWDLGRFTQRLKMIYPPEAVPGYEKQRLLRLGAVIAIAALLAALSDLVRLNITFVPAFFLGLLVFIGLRVVLGALVKIQPKEEEEEQT